MIRTGRSLFLLGCVGSMKKIMSRTLCVLTSVNEYFRHKFQVKKKYLCFLSKLVSYWALVARDLLETQNCEKIRELTTIFIRITLNWYFTTHLRMWHEYCCKYCQSSPGVRIHVVRMPFEVCRQQSQPSEIGSLMQCKTDVMCKPLSLCHP